MRQRPSSLPPGPRSDGSHDYGDRGNYALLERRHDTAEPPDTAMETMKPFVKEHGAERLKRIIDLLD